MFTFLNSSGQVQFVRDDAEQADWTQEEMLLQCEFPYDEGKPIERGMRILFQDPATDDWKCYEIRTCSFHSEEGYIQITAEDIAISELTDCHYPNKTEFTNKTAGQALTTVLSGTGWSVGTNTASNTSSGDVTRGSVWNAVNLIQKNWNVYIMPRVTVGASGITAKVLDILPAEGVWRGLRLSINKNMTDPVVTYDDSELYTALYGYGATSDGSETTFASVVWSATSSHPAKPSGQKYIEDPAKTALYGRNGTPRFGYYQNTAITDGATLLQKTWEVLKTCCDPKISIDGTVTDLKRLGYADQPLRLHDMAIVEVDPDGTQYIKQIIQLKVDLLDPTNNRPNIGDYIPNIVYINRETNNYATGGGVGVEGDTLQEATLNEMEAETENNAYDIEENTEAISENTQNIAANTHDISVNAENIELNAETISLHTETLDEHGDIFQQAGMCIDPNTGVLIYADGGSDMNGHTLGGMLSVQKDKVEMVVGTNQSGNYIKAGEICLAINATTGQSLAQILADHVIMDSISGTPIDVAINGKLSATDITAQLINTAFAEVGSTFTANVIQTNDILVGTGGQYGIGSNGTGYFGNIYINGSQGYWGNITVGNTTYRVLMSAASG